MKRKLFGIAVITALFAVTSCKKAASVNGGSWTFKSQTYTVTSGIADVSQNPPVPTVYSIATLVTACQASNAYSDIVFTFFTYPTASGTYTITPNQYPDSGSHQIAVNMILATGSNYAQNSYGPTPFSAATATANVTVDGNGWVTISIPSLEMVNADTTKRGDSAVLVTNVKQTQGAL